MGVQLTQIKDLTVRYKPGRGGVVHALEGLDLEIFQGEVIGVLGESGSGKSTLAAATLRMFPAHSECGGAVVFEGHDLLATKERVLRKLRGARIALIPQDPAAALNPVIRVGGQISEVLRAHLRLGRAERRQRVHEVLREVGFDDAERIFASYAHELSGGQRQRVLIAQAIACRPALIIADESTSKLDPKLELQIIDLMSNLVRRHGMALLWITHNPATLPGFADRIAVMYAGKIVEEGPAERILRDPLHPYTRALVGLVRPGGGGGTRLPQIPGEAPDLTQATCGCRFEPRCTERMKRCAARHPQLISAQSHHLVSCFKYGE